MISGGFVTGEIGHRLVEIGVGGKGRPDLLVEFAQESYSVF
jgi:hypothetical protein